METALFWSGIVILLVLLALTAELARGGRRLVLLREVEPLSGAEMPSVSVVVPARDEARAVEAALASVLAQDAPRLEVIAVDDRSTDGTGAILDRMAAANPRLRVIHVAELPPGWLGKNHALQAGADAATGELLLFTDADVVMAPDAVRRAAAHLVRAGYDHLAAAPLVELPGVVLKTFGVVFALMFSFFTRPWRVRDPASPYHVGVGAFNLLRADVYRRIGGHRPIAMRPDDDVKLGKLVKKHGFRQDFAVGAGTMSVDWYASVRETIRGLRKNGFAGVDYRVEMVLLATFVQLVFFILPFVAVLAVPGPAWWIYAACVAVILFQFSGMAYQQRVPAWYGVLFPVASALIVLVMWNAMLYALRHRGIEWRGTHYPLDELRANRV